MDPVVAPRIRVLIADDDRSIRAALADLIASDPGLELVGVAQDADSAIELATRTTPDVALVDVKMPGGGERAARGILAHGGGTRVVALSAHADRPSINSMLVSGALGYLVKGAPIEQILEAIHRAADGHGLLSGEVTAEVIRELAGKLEREEEAATRLRSVRASLEAVIADDAIAMEYQPIVHLADGAVLGYEALARFRIEPQNTPDVWFGAAAEVGLLVELELAAVRAAMRGFARMPRAAWMSFNLSPVTAMSTRLESALLGQPRDRIVVEITERARIEDYDALAAGLAGLRAHGGRLAIDDAGAGFGSLRHILLLSPDMIKLDVSLTRDIDRDRARRAMAAALISFADEMGLTIVAEGIETARELDTLRELGVRVGQGFYLARPSPTFAGPSPALTLGAA